MDPNGELAPGGEGDEVGREDASEVVVICAWSGRNGGSEHLLL